MPLTDVALRNAKARDKSYKFYDGHGPLVLVHPNGSRYWQLKYRYDNKEKIFSIGTYPTIKIAEARERAVEAVRS